MTLRQTIHAHELFTGKLYDAPDCSFRGYRVFLPGRCSMEDFKQAVEILVEYKYNCLIMEVGGAMEYERHPEINRVWKALWRRGRVSIVFQRQGI